MEDTRSPDPKLSEEKKYQLKGITDTIIKNSLTLQCKLSNQQPEHF